MYAKISDTDRGYINNAIGDLADIEYSVNLPPDLDYSNMYWESLPKELRLMLKFLMTTDKYPDVKRVVDTTRWGVTFFINHDVADKMLEVSFNIDGYGSKDEVPDLNARHLGKTNYIPRKAAGVQEIINFHELITGQRGTGRDFATVIKQAIQECNTLNQVNALMPSVLTAVLTINNYHHRGSYGYTKAKIKEFIDTKGDRSRARLSTIDMESLDRVELTSVDNHIAKLILVLSTLLDRDKQEAVDSYRNIKITEVAV